MRKDLVLAACSGLLLLGVATASAADLCGDVNNSGAVNTSDALAVLKRAVEQPVGLTCGPPGIPVKTGQFAGTGTGSDGDLRNGSPRTFTDNGDGTITDYATGLMWEKKDDLGGLHDKDTAFTWSTGDGNMNGTLVTNFLANMNAGSGFAGHTDWRIPNRFEFETLFNLGTSFPSTHFAFNKFCQPGCSISNCSCTSSLLYWTSSAVQSEPSFAWILSFQDSGVGGLSKTNTALARAVRNAPELTTFPTCEAPDPPQCSFNDPCSDGVCSLSRTACSQQTDCPFSPGEQCCCAGFCI